jgi:hypothetical protein
VRMGAGVYLYQKPKKSDKKKKMFKRRQKKICFRLGGCVAQKYI